MTPHERRLLIRISEEVVLLMAEQVDRSALARATAISERASELQKLSEKVRHEGEAQDRKHKRETRDTGDRAWPTGRR